MSLTVIDRPSPNFDQRLTPIELVVLHYTGMQSGEIALARLTDPAPLAGRYPGPWQDAALDPASALSRVSANYVVGEEGAVYRLVAETDRAWHAGRGVWRGAGDLNSRAIGIEIVNGGHDFGLPPYRPEQIEAVIGLLKDILTRHRLPARAVIGHSDLAPDRKLDPGEHFPWERLCAAHVAVGPRAAAAGGAQVGPGDANEEVVRVQKGLGDFGYDIAPTGLYDAWTEIVVRAFQRRFRRNRVDGVADEETRVRLHSLLAEYG